MKKLKLRALELGATEMLTRAQLKTILGGDDGSGSGDGGACDERPCEHKTSDAVCTNNFGIQGKCTWQACTGYGYSFYNCIP